MKTTRLNMVTPPHEVRDPEKLAELVAAYQSGSAPVTPVVILDMGSAAYAICGSHRMRAVGEVRGDDIDVEELGWIVEDGVGVYERASEGTREMLDAMTSGRSVDYHELVAALLADDVLCGDSDAALADQH